ncbi:pseudaminic acid biosynthesis-associated methylase [Rheinheimera sp.]|uniref:pseudaminic acid biosynthesis-associated methylase n=1 Tax=Rheinheimera sp. TaxID=1869214 RepID=UPI00307E6190
MKYKTDQELFWAGDFGDNYVDRYKGEVSIASNTSLFSKILNSTKSVSTVIEFGANIGQNLMAIKRLLPNAELSAVEINEKAANRLKREMQDVTVYHSSILDFSSVDEFDFVLIKGVLIHIDPCELQSVYELLYKACKKYICISVYYNPTPVEVLYRGHEGKLFKRDFAGELMDRYPDLKLVDYGFVYHRDNNFPLDDATWFLLEKS